MLKSLPELADEALGRGALSLYSAVLCCAVFEVLPLTAHVDDNRCDATKSK